MKTGWIDFLKGFVVGAFFMSIIFNCLAHIRDESTIKLYKEGKIECATVGGDFICRKVQK